MDYLVELEGSDEDRGSKLQKVGMLSLVRERAVFPLKYFEQAHANGSLPFRVMNVERVEGNCMGIFSRSDISDTWAEVKFQMFAYVLIPRLKPILPSHLRKGRFHRHSIDLTGPRNSSEFQLCLDGLRLAREMFRGVVGPENGLIHEPIRYLRRGIEIQAIAPKVPAHRAANALTAVGCSDIIDVSSYSMGDSGTSGIQRQQITPDAVVSGSLVEVEVYIRAAPLTGQGEHRIHYELCSICLVDDTVFQFYR